jgi:hypothetical protein
VQVPEAHGVVLGEAKNFDRRSGHEHFIFEKVETEVNGSGAKRVIASWEHREPTKRKQKEGARTKKPIVAYGTGTTTDRRFEHRLWNILW